MKILLTAPRDETVLGIVGEYCASALKKLGHDVSIFDFRPSPYAHRGFLSKTRSLVRSVFPLAPSISSVPAVRLVFEHKLNKELLAQAESYKPDIFLALLGENIYPETVEKIKKSGAVTANWLFDTLLVPYRLELMRKLAPFYDRIILIDSLDILEEVDFSARRIDSIPLGCDPDIHHKIELSEAEKKMYSCDVAFVGTVTPERERILESLRDLDLGIWGRWSRKNVALKRHYRWKDVYGAEAVKIYNAAKIVIDIHNRFLEGRRMFNVTPRVFEVPASGGFLITNNISQLATLYKIGEEMAVYDDIDGLRRQIAFYLLHESERVAIVERGYRRAHLNHTYCKRLGTLINSLKELK